MFATVVEEADWSGFQYRLVVLVLVLVSLVLCETPSLLLPLLLARDEKSGSCFLIERCLQ